MSWPVPRAIPARDPDDADEARVPDQNMNTVMGYGVDTLMGIPSMSDAPWTRPKDRIVKATPSARILARRARAMPATNPMIGGNRTADGGAGAGYVETGLFVPRRYLWPRPELLADGGTDNAASCDFRVKSPAAKCRVRVDVYFKATDGTADPDLRAPAVPHLLLLQAMTIDYRGDHALTNIIDDGTAAGGGLQIPEKSNLQGYSREFFSMTEWVKGLFTPSTTLALPQGQWWLGVSWEAAHTMADAEWFSLIPNFECLVTRRGRFNIDLG